MGSGSVYFFLPWVRKFADFFFNGAAKAFVWRACWGRRGSWGNRGNEDSRHPFVCDPRGRPVQKRKRARLGTAREVKQRSLKGLLWSCRKERRVLCGESSKANGFRSFRGKKDPKLKNSRDTSNFCKALQMLLDAFLNLEWLFLLHEGQWARVSRAACRAHDFDRPLCVYSL